MKISLPIIFSQFDSRWANLTLGFNASASFNFYNYACLVCDLAMVAKYYGNDETPITINDRLKALGSGKGFQAGTGNYIYGAITKLFSGIQEKLTVTPQALTDEQLNEIKTALDAGYPVVFQIDFDPKDVDLDSHFVTVVGYNPDDENDFTIADPLGGVEVSLKKYLGWLKPSVRKTVEKYLIYVGKVPAATGMMLVPKDVYPNIIHGSTQWDKTVTEYLPNEDPKQKNFEDVQKVVAGIKSEATGAKNALLESEKTAQVAQTEISNLKEKVANVTTDCQRQLDFKEAEISTLKATIPNLDKLEVQYQGTIEALRGDLREAQKQTGLKNNSIAELEAKLKQCESGLKPSKSLTNLINYLKKILGQK